MPTGTYIRTEEHRQKLKEAWQKPGYKEKMSAVHRGQKTWSGKKHSKESILKMRKAHFSGKERMDIRGNGYVYLYFPDHPMAKNGRVPEHNIVMEKNINRTLSPGEIVHHINGIKSDNRIENLCLCTSKEHKMIHAKLNGFGTKIQSRNERDQKTGRFIAA